MFVAPSHKRCCWHKWMGGPRSGNEEGICFLWWRRRCLRSSELNSRLLPLCQQQEWYVHALHALSLCSNHIFSSSRASPSYWEPCLTTESWKTSPPPLPCGWAALSSVQGAKTSWRPTTALNPCPLSQKRGNPGIKSSPYSIAMKKVRCLFFPLLLVFLYSPGKFWWCFRRQSSAWPSVGDWKPPPVCCPVWSDAFPNSPNRCLAFLGIMLLKCRFLV